MKKRVYLKIFVVLILYVMMFPYTTIYAATSAEAGRYVASYAKNFLDKHNITWSMGYGDCGVVSGNNYISECVGFVRKMYQDAINYKGDIPVPSGNSGVGNTPATTQAGMRGNNFKMVAVNDLSKALPGDIIENFHHDMIYIGTVDGKTQVIANNGKNNNSSGFSNGLFVMNEYVHSTNAFGGHSTMGSGSGECNFRIWRLTDSAAAALGDASTFNANGDLVEAGSISSNSNGLSTANMSNFYYNGIPDGKYSVTKGFLSRIIDALKDIFNFLIALIPNIIKMVFVGWAAIFESLITTAVKTATGDENLESVPVTSTDIESGDNITIEKIVFNKMSIFDVNFFNSN